MPDSALSPHFDGKFLPQVSARRPLPRPRLALPAALLEGTCSVVSVVAPAGYGKTTLLAGWYAGCTPAQRAWLNLDDNDNDPQRLLRLLIAAVQSARPGLGTHALAQIEGRAQALPMSVLESLVSDLARLDAALLIFVDDVHVLVDEQAIRVVEWLLQYAPAPVRVIFGSRLAPRLPLAGLRLRGRLLEIDQTQLAFTESEAQALCSERLGSPLPLPALQRLMDKTEGWPAAIELLVLALQDAPDRAVLLNDFWGSERAIVDYLGEVVFGRLSLQQRGLLYRFAQFDRFCAALLDAATGDPGARDLLQELNRRKLFLLAMDRSGSWFRFHHLVQDYLRSNPPAGLAGNEVVTLLAGARWFHTQGLVDEAIDCAVRARAWEQACSWLAASVEDSAQRQGTAGSLLHWVRVIPRQWIDRYPLIRISVAFSLAFSTRRDEVEAALEDIQRSIAVWEQLHPGDPGLPQLHCAAELQRLLLLAVDDSNQELLAGISGWLERWPEAPMRYLGDACTLAALACKANGELKRGLAFIRRARDLQLRDRGYYALSWNTILEALLQLKGGDFHAARAASQRGLQLIHERLNGYPEHAAFQHVILAAIAYEFGALDDAARELEKGSAAIDATGIADLLILTYLTRARLQFSRGDCEGGLQALRLGRQTGRKRRLERVVVTLAAEECTWLIRHGQRAAALSLAHQFGFDLAIFAEPNLAADKASRVGPRLLLDSEPEMALAQLLRPLQRSSEKGFQRRRCELLILQAAALLRSGRQEDALLAWQQVVEACERLGYRRVALDDLPLLADLRQVAAGPAWLATSGTPETASSAAQEALTRKELTILRHLESGLANREIAESLFISEGTLKWHLHNIYRKLGCKNRTSALSSARKGGFL